MSVTDPYLDAYEDLDRHVCADLPEYEPEQEPPTAIDLPDIERTLRRLRVCHDRLHELQQVATDDKARIDAWLEDRSAVVVREIEWWSQRVENWMRAHVAAGGAKTQQLPSGTVQLRQSPHKIMELSKAPSESVPAEFVRVKREWAKADIAKQTAPGPLAEGVEAPEGFVAHWAVDANGERIPDVVRLVPVADSFSLKVG